MSRPDRTEAVGTGEPAEAEIRLLAPGSSLGERYEIRRVLGTGGYAAVYLAWDRELRAQVALKVLRADRMSQGALRRLQREALLARDLVSPRLLRIYDIGQAEGAVYLTLEYVDGGTLRERLRSGALAIDEALRLAAQILEGLAALHGAGIVHRDIKPGNILLTAQGEVKLGDFGLALHWDRQDTRLTVSETIVGTVDYIAPEQALGGEAGPRSDLYALGVVLFEMLAGKVPYESDSRLGAMLKHVKQDAPDVRTLRKEVPAWLAAVVGGLLARDPERRYSSSAEVLAELERRSLFRTPHWRRGALRRAAWAAALVAVLALSAALWWARQPRFAQLAMPQENTLVALDRNGEILWRKDNVNVAGGYTVARLRPGGPRRVVGVVRPPAATSPQLARQLSILELETGRLLDTVSLPESGGFFGGYSESWAPEVHAVDLDDDGADEILVTYIHTPFWPSFTVLYEPRIARSRPIFFGAGHHRFAGAVDLDGDGRKEVLLLGLNNRLGYRRAVAALRLEPPANAPGRIGYAFGATSPGLTFEAAPKTGLLWYALIRRGPVDDSRPIEIERAARRLAVHFREGTAALDFEGFPAGSSGPVERQDLRFRAYEILAECQRFVDLRQADRAAAVGERAIAFAEQAGDAVLAQWARIAQAGNLAAAGRPGEAEEMYQRLLDEETDPPEVALAAARAFHLRGDLTRAQRWYRTGISAAGVAQEGRARSELIEGLALAAAEAGDAASVRPDIDRFRTAFSNEHEKAVAIEAFLAWHEGEYPADLRLRGGEADLDRYWALEIRWARGEEDAAALLREVEVENDRNGAAPLLSSLRAEILESLGRSPEALAAAASAWNAIRESALTDIPSRAHLDLVGRRFARLARAQGKAKDAKEAERALREWRRRTEAASREPR